MIIEKVGPSNISYNEILKSREWYFIVCGCWTGRTLSVSTEDLMSTIKTCNQTFLGPRYRIQILERFVTNNSQSMSYIVMYLHVYMYILSIWISSYYTLVFEISNCLQTLHTWTDWVLFTIPCILQMRDIKTQKYPPPPLKQPRSKDYKYMYVSSSYGSFKFTIKMTRNLCFQFFGILSELEKIIEKSMLLVWNHVIFVYYL